MSQVAAFKSTILRNVLSDLSVTSFSISFPQNEIPLIPCTLVADTHAGVVDLNTTSAGLYSDPELQSAAFEIADFILKYADITGGTIALATTAGWQTYSNVIADRVTVAALINLSLN
jgi:hypothetical protein